MTYCYDPNINHFDKLGWPPQEDLKSIHVHMNELKKKIELMEKMLLAIMDDKNKKTKFQSCEFCNGTGLICP